MAEECDDAASGAHITAAGDKKKLFCSVKRIIGFDDDPGFVIVVFFMRESADNGVFDETDGKTFVYFARDCIDNRAADDYEVVLKVFLTHFSIEADAEFGEILEIGAKEQCKVDGIVTVSRASAFRTMRIWRAYYYKGVELPVFDEGRQEVALFEILGDFWSLLEILEADGETRVGQGIGVGNGTLLRACFYLVDDARFLEFADVIIDFLLVDIKY